MQTYYGKVGIFASHNSLLIESKVLLLINKSSCRELNGKDCHFSGNRRAFSKPKGKFSYTHEIHSLTMGTLSLCHVFFPFLLFDQKNRSLYSFSPDLGLREMNLPPLVIQVLDQ